jgi:hypothetical protein
MRELANELAFKGGDALTKEAVSIETRCKPLWTQILESELARDLAGLKKFSSRNRQNARTLSQEEAIDFLAAGPSCPRERRHLPKLAPDSHSKEWAFLSDLKFCIGSLSAPSDPARTQPVPQPIPNEHRSMRPLPRSLSCQFLHINSVQSGFPLG